MKNIDDLEKKFKSKANILMVLDYDGTVTSTEPRINSPFSNAIFKRVVENFARKDYIKMVMVTNRKISDFRKEFEIESDTIEIYGHLDDKFCNESGVSFAKKEDIMDEVFAQNAEYNIIYAGDDKLLMSKTKEMEGNTVGILPLCKEGEKLVDFSISQNTFEDFLITTHNVYL